MFTPRRRLVKTGMELLHRTQEGKGRPEAVRPASAVFLSLGFKRPKAQAIRLRLEDGACRRFVGDQAIE
jgi:hypothetical protein